MQVPKGSIYGFISKNGTGKTTLMRLICGLQEPTGGEYSLYGVESSSPDIASARRRMGAVVSRIFANILSNAAKYSDGDLAVTLCETGCATFTNSAHGLTAIDVQRLFDRFYTVENAKGSTGLGLSIAKLLTEKLGGELTAELSDGKLSISLKF